MEKKIDRAVRIYPWYAGLEGDLLFYIAVDTLFLTVVKNFTDVQIVSLNALSQIICIALQFPVLFVIRRVGNTNSVRLGALFMLLSSILITIGKTYSVVLLGRICHDVAAIFYTASVVMLKNNLELAGRRSDFVKLRAKGNTVYSAITMVIAFVASLMFNLNHYLPMIGCITTCATGFLLSFFMKDFSGSNKLALKNEKGGKNRFRYSGLVIMTLAVYGLFYPIVNSGQSDGKLFIQQHLLQNFNVEDTALVIGAVICVSRVVRVFSNILFARLYEKYQTKTGVALPVLLCTAIGLLLFGARIPGVFFKIAVMSLGYIIILFARDPFRLYIQDMLLEHTPAEQHQTLLTMMTLVMKVGTAGMGLGFSAVLLRFPMAVVMAILFVIAQLEILLSLKLYHMVEAVKTK
ncbi:MAG: hypothetical protein IKT52_01055 [Oscillospiraceae bacterium]|nr:hypothetical protein [Oscillospiraceae bacterium]